MKKVPTKIYGWNYPVELPESVLVKKQSRRLETRKLGRMSVSPVVRWDDECGNGHNTFSVTADTVEWIDGRKYDGGGCCHDTIAVTHPEIAHLIKWHLVSSDGPMHYLANTEYHALEHGPIGGWLMFTDRSLPVPIVGMHAGYHRNGYGKQNELWLAKWLCHNDPRYTLNIDPKTAKKANLDHARSSACWPEATDEELKHPYLRAHLAQRLPALMEEFYRDVTNFGFTY
jgi:hypothetical protein